jgi:hypothetical protein
MGGVGCSFCVLRRLEISEDGGDGACLDGLDCSSFEGLQELRSRLTKTFGGTGADRIKTWLVVTVVVVAWLCLFGTNFWNLRFSGMTLDGSAYYLLCSAMSLVIYLALALLFMRFVVASRLFESFYVDLRCTVLAGLSRGFKSELQHCPGFN